MNARKFSYNRKRRYRLTEKRIKEILIYIVYCYWKFKEDGVVFNKTIHKQTSKIPFEEHLTYCFVTDYLTELKNKYLGKEERNNVQFGCETVKHHFDVNQKGGKDQIDIFITDIALQTAWKNSSKIYFSIECKIINKLKDSNLYIGDIQKFCDRTYKETRLPFEGMIAYISDNQINSEQLRIAINERLENKSTITTTKFLTYEKVVKEFSNSYLSQHKKNFGNYSTFSTYHLFLDYGDNIT